MKRWACAIVILLLLGGAGLASCPPVVVSSSYATYAPAAKVVERVVIKEVPQIVYAVAPYAVLSYGGAYVPPLPSPAHPPATPPAAAPQASDTDRILQAIQGVRVEVGDLNARVRVLEAERAHRHGHPQPAPPAGPAVQPGPPPAAAPQPKAGANAAPRGLSILQGRCASCHEARLAKEKGGEVVLFDGPNLARLDVKTQLAVLRAMRTGSMPKGGKPLSDEEYAHAAEYIEALK